MSNSVANGCTGVFFLIIQSYIEWTIKESRRHAQRWLVGRRAYNSIGVLLYYYTK